MNTSGHHCGGRLFLFIRPKNASNRNTVPGNIIPVFFGNEIKPVLLIEADRIVVSIHRYETASGTVSVGGHIFDKTDNIPVDTLSCILFQYCQSSYFYCRIVFLLLGIRNASA